MHDASLLSTAVACGTLANPGNLFFVSLFLTAVNCGSLANPTNGRVSYPYETTYRDTATYSCNTGYNLDGSSTRRCSSTGSWSGSEPTCRGMLLLYLILPISFR